LGTDANEFHELLNLNGESAAIPLPEGSRCHSCPTKAATITNRQLRKNSGASHFAEAIEVMGIS
jgi:hypothetical protein